jgi:hypothetical protein
MSWLGLFLCLPTNLLRYRYFLFLLINVVFIFLFTTTYLALIQDLANSPAQVPKKIARALRKSDAKRFFVSYVVLQGNDLQIIVSRLLRISLGLGIMPLQLLNLGTIIPRVFYLIFWTRTPRGTGIARIPDESS